MLQLLKSIEIFFANTAQVHKISGTRLVQSYNLQYCESNYYGHNNCTYLDMSVHNHSHQNHNNGTVNQSPQVLRNCS